ncbi:MAG: NADH-quinone oxidoreductase subunit L, partial [Proteobacteria bacterium]|nr:NADH-quinone oxidoreductase subunit L [Pseudomonadota bacterium]
IIAMHHEQDIRRMGGIRKYMPITYWTALVGSLALIGFPGSSGFFSKDLLIEAVRESHWHAGSSLGDRVTYWTAYLSVLLGVFVTALYSFRMFFLVFHGKERMSEKQKSHLHETPAVVTVPLILLAIPSAAIGWLTVDAVLFEGYFGGAIHVLSSHDVLAQLKDTFWHGPAALVAHIYVSPVFYLAALGVLTAWFLYLKRPDVPETIRRKVSGLYELLDRKYYFDDLYVRGFAAAGRNVGQFLWQKGDRLVIDGLLVNGTARAVGWMAGYMRHIQTGYLYTYAFAMIIGLTMLLGWLIWVR